MIIERNTEILLFRYNNYKMNDFISEHISVLKKYDFVWMLKIGKKTSIDRINTIIEQGGWLILRSPKANGSKSYLARFTEYRENEPNDMCYPSYYCDIINSKIDEDNFYSPLRSYQWFKLIYLNQLDEQNTENIVVSKTNKKVNEVINTTRTAVMYVKNTMPIEVK